jgi:thiaminase (transcriptional activator TenA)
MAGLSQRLFALGQPNLERQLAHPTVRGIANGDLDQTRFRSWLVQDYLFLLDYVRLFALAAARAPDTDTLGRLVDLAHATFHEELSLHRAGYSELGRSMAATGLPTEPRYRRWIETYADPDFAALAAWCAALLDRATDGLPAARLAACERAFLTSLRHEHAFWDAEEPDPQEGRH